MPVRLETLLASNPDVCGGRPRIGGTRITVHQIVVLYKTGQTPEEIADEYPQLTLAQVYTALAYYHANREEVESALAAEAAEAESLREPSRTTPEIQSEVDRHQVVESIQKGLDELERGEYLTHEEVKARLQRWLG